jgi:hypothetical protein
MHPPTHTQSRKLTLEKFTDGRLEKVHSAKEFTYGRAILTNTLQNMVIPYQLYKVKITVCSK